MRSSRRLLLRLGALGLAASLVSGAVQAQAQEGGSGQLAGIVTGTDGAPLAGAIVTVSSAALETGEASLTTDEAGRFALGPIPPGFYDVAVELPGYRRGLLATLKVEDGHTTDASMVLERRAGGEDGY